MARIAVAHGNFNVEPIGADTAALATAVATPAPAPVQAAPAPAAPERKSRAHRASAAIRVPARSDAAAGDPKNG